MASAIPDIRELLSEDEEGNDGGEGGGMATTPDKRGCEASPATGSSKMQKSEWFDKGAVVGAAIKSHQAWYEATKQTFLTYIQDASEVQSSVPLNVRSDVSLELQLMRARLHAVKLVA